MTHKRDFVQMVNKENQRWSPKDPGKEGSREMILESPVSFGGPRIDPVTWMWQVLLPPKFTSLVQAYYTHSKQASN